MKKYVTSGGYRWSLDAKIKEVEIERETESSVWIDGRVNRKITEYCVYHDTWEKAHSHLLFHAKRKLNNANDAYQRAKGQLYSIEKLKKEG